VDDRQNTFAKWKNIIEMIPKGTSLPIRIARGLSKIGFGMGFYG
jgi:hypothetical protein